jgi:hypothetical protein
MDKVFLLLPPYLHSSSYATASQLRDVAERAYTLKDEAIYSDPVWSWWRGVLEYVACVEFAREAVKALPTGREIGSHEAFVAQYHCASLVFFAQATLDNMAVWLSQVLNLEVSGSNCAFHKAPLKKALGERSTPLAAALLPHEQFIEDLERYRQAWIHRLSGGARVYSDAPPSESNAEIQIMVPINPSVDDFGLDPKSRLRRIARARTNNKGKWLRPVGEFADSMTDSLRVFLLDLVAVALREPIPTAEGHTSTKPKR